MGPTVVAEEFGDFEVGVTFQNLPLSVEKWIVFSQNGVSLHKISGKRGRSWRVPDALDDLIFEIDGKKVAILYGKEMRMRKLLRKLSEQKVSLILGYIELSHYNSHQLVANGWGASQVSGVPTILLSHLNEKVGYSFFTKERNMKSGIIFLHELYSFVEVSPICDDKEIRHNREFKGDSK